MNATILRAQLWELWRLTRLELLFRFLFPLTFLSVLPITSAQDVKGLAALVFLTTIVTSLLQPTLYNLNGSGRICSFPFRIRFTMPIPTFWLAFIPLVWIVSTNTILFFGISALSSKILDVSLPATSLLPIVVLGSIVLTLDAWSEGHLVARCAGAATLAVTVWLWLEPRLPLTSDFFLLSTNTRHANPSPFATYLLGLVGAAVFSVCCVKNVRELRSSGVQETNSWSAPHFQRILLEPERTIRFRSSLHAQFWYEMRVAWIPALVAAGLGMLFFGVFTMVLLSTGDSLSVNSLLRVAILLPLFSTTLPLYAMLGLRGSGKVRWLSNYDATRPIHVSTSIAVKTSVAFVVILTSSVTFTLVAILCGLVVAPASVNALARSMYELLSTHPLQAIIVATQRAAMLVFIYWTWNSAVCGLLYNSVRGMRAMWPLLLAQIAISLILILSIVHQEMSIQLMPLIDLLLYGCGLFLILTTAYKLVRAVRMDLLQAHTVLLILVGWLVLLSTIKSHLVDLLQDGSSVSAMTMGFLCLPLAAFASAPLSLAALRHQ